ncbi:hypothetical protein MMC30_009280, partial [Trapelia coarctata]|nr:hypothetical protein [Trapelia coarctata]
MGFIKYKGDSGATTQNSGDCKDNPFVVEDDCLDALSERGSGKEGLLPYYKSAEYIPDGQVNAVDLVGPTDSRVLQIFYGTADLKNIFQTGGNNEDSAVND